jgi:ribosomal protein S12 methylthiotransferase accessory factor YcaO
MRADTAHYGLSQDFESLRARGTAYASQKNLASNLDFLDKGSEVAVSDLPRLKADSPLEELTGLVELLAAQGLEAFGRDLTTDDVDEVGFKVCKVVVPSMRHLDLKHSRRHLAAGRLYDVPVKLGLLDRPNRPDELNPDPHPFP